MRAQAIPRPALLATIFVFNFIEFLQSGMVVFSASATMGYIGAGPEEYALATALYAAVAVVAISQMTACIQRFGWRDYMLGAALVSAVGAWTCAASTSLFGFAGGRVLMAAGGGVFMTAARMMVNFIPPSPARIIGIASFGGALSGGLALASLVAGTLVGIEAWSGIFLLLATLALLGGALAWRWLPEGADTLDVSPSRFDAGDGLALGCAAFLLLYGLQHLVYDWHRERTEALALVGGGLLLAGLFYTGHRRRTAPFLRLEMLGSPRYRTGLLIFASCYTLLGIFNTVLPQLVQRVLGIPLQQAGELQAAGMGLAIPVFAGMLLVVRKHPHATKFYVTGFLSLAAFGWHFAHLDPAAQPWRSVAPWIGLFGTFVILAMATTALHSFTDFQRDNVLFSNAQQLKNMLGQVGTALGAGCAGVLLQDRGALHGARLAERASVGGAVLLEQGSLLAGLDVFLLLAATGVVGAVLLAVQRRFD